ncbi:5285_t:CDS:1, partial [Entrophospora sp. SA101]
MRLPSTYSKTCEYDPDAMCNYQPNGSKIPISICHHIFGNFKSKLSAKKIDIRDYKTSGEGGVIEYLEHLAKVYHIEDKRKEIFQDMMHDLFGYEMNPFSITDNCTVGGGQCALLILEAINELGMGGGDPHRQVCGSYGKYISIVPDCERYLNPCFLLHLAGPWLGIS